MLYNSTAYSLSTQIEHINIRPTIPPDAWSKIKHKTALNQYVGNLKKKSHSASYEGLWQKLGFIVDI